MYTCSCSFDRVDVTGVSRLWLWHRGARGPAGRCGDNSRRWESGVNPTHFSINEIRVQARSRDSTLVCNRMSRCPSRRILSSDHIHKHVRAAPPRRHSTATAAQGDTSSSMPRHAVTSRGRRDLAVNNVQRSYDYEQCIDYRRRGRPPSSETGIVADYNFAFFFAFFTPMANFLRLGLLDAYVRPARSRADRWPIGVRRARA